MPKLIVFTGCLGTGKSTLAEKLAKEKNWRLLQIDKLRRLMIPKPDYNHQEMLRMYRVMLAAAKIWLKEGNNVILDSTFSIPLYHRMLEELTRATKVKLKVFRCVCSDEEAIRRIKKKRKKGVMDAEDVTVKRYFEHKENRFKLIDFCSVQEINTEAKPEVVFKRLKKCLND